jgi:hypothetical protein
MLSRRLEEVYDHDNEASKYSCIYWFFKTNTIGYYIRCLDPVDKNKQKSPRAVTVAVVTGRQSRVHRF